MPQPDSTPNEHIPVLIDEVIDLLSPKPDQRYVDATAGLGGHAAAIARLVAPSGSVILNDLDETNLDRAREVVEQAAPGVEVAMEHGSFSQLAQKLSDRPADMLLADLGFASGHVDDPSRGFSFKQDGPLDMRMNRSAPITAAELIETLSEDELTDIIRRFGEERNARAVARKLVAIRAHDPITTTAQLATIVRSVVRTRGGKRTIDPATRTFQALRIAVNDEIGSIESLLRSVSHAAQRLASGRSDSWLRPGARVAVISFHSLEDRPVKRAFADLAERGLAESVTRKPVRAGEEELARNVRARSAKLRVIRLSGGQGGPSAHV